MAKKDAQNVFQMLLGSNGVNLDLAAFDALIAHQGVEFDHYRGMPCPVGMSDPNDVSRRPHEHHENCSNGYIYTKAGQFTSGFIGNTSDYRFMDAGQLDGSTATIIVPRFYDCPEAAATERVGLSNFDRLYLKENVIDVETSHLFAHHETGVDRLQFPAVHVIDLIDWTGARYKECVDFQIKNGDLHWGDRRPPTNPDTGFGGVCAVRYSYKPFWYVKNLPHEVRVTRYIDSETGEDGIAQAPQLAIIHREYAFQKEQSDQLAKQDRKLSGQQPVPADGGFGDR